jgi:hypothetical protein
MSLIALTSIAASVMASLAVAAVAGPTQAQTHIVAAHRAARSLELLPGRAGPQEKPDASRQVMSTSRGVASRRGPSTGLKFVQSIDSDYRRTERLRFEVTSDEVRAASARLLGPAGTPVNVPISVVMRADDTTKRPIVVAELALAALAQAEYELELTLEEGEAKSVVTYRFGIVP